MMDAMLGVGSTSNLQQIFWANIWVRQISENEPEDVAGTNPEYVLEISYVASIHKWPLSEPNVVW